jgi:hypothetical protein
VQSNAVRKWYHAPWMHTGNAGREFVHGLTRERHSRPGELHPNQTEMFQNWAVSVYNPQAAYTIGQVWKDPAHPNPSIARFEEGATSIKLLFTLAPVSQVPYLKGSFEWDANVHTHLEAPPPLTRAVQRVRLLQIDVAVRDSRVDSTTGWVFGTFVYDGDATGTTSWDRLIPVGVMWGNDPTITPARVQQGVRLTECWINPAVGPPQHLGWAGRLDGPVDNPASSCLSCHSTAQWPNAVMVPPRGTPPDKALNWFRNIRAGDPFDQGGQSLDYSLQLAVGINNREQTQVIAGLSKPPTEKFTITGVESLRQLGPTRSGGADEEGASAIAESLSPWSTLGQTKPPVAPLGKSRLWWWGVGAAIIAVLLGVIFRRRQARSRASG